ncbi:MAG: ATP-binding protein [Pseudomonadota bacterium]
MIPAPAARTPHHKFLTAPGELGYLIEQHDWTGTPLGPIGQWPQSLKTAVSLMLSSRQPMWIGWGPEATFLYNDAYINVLSHAKHPSALGRPAAQVWSEIWDICGPLAALVFERGDATVADDVRLFMNRGHFLEETYYSFSYSPIRDESGNVAGLFCPNLEVTAKHLSARRLRTLSELASKALVEKTVDAACASAISKIAENPDDIPFALLYLAGADGQPARLAQAAHLAPHAGDIESHFPLAAVLAGAEARQVELADLPFLPVGLANQRITQALVLPMLASPSQTAIGALVLGVSPARKLDEDYRNFFGLLATHVGNAIQNARTAEDERQHIEALAELDRAKTSFFSNVSHEFRTPLTLMLGPMEEALADPAAPLAPVQRERLHLVQRNALRLQKLVNTLLEFSRVQAGRTQAAFAPTDCAALTADLASSFRSTIESAGMRLVIDCPPLPAPVYLDPSMWETILLNLLSNAFKFTFSGEIRVQLRMRDSHVDLRVSDTGTGIPAAHLPRLFERFYRVTGSSSRTHEGSGIGLALVHDLVQLHGGTIDVHSSAGQGSTFHIALPVGHAHLNPKQVHRHAPAPNSALAARAYVAEAEGWSAMPADADAGVEAERPAPGERERIVVADDNADMREYLRRILAARWDVELVNNGEEALRAALRQPPDLILSDVMMPRLDGFGLLAALRQDPATTRIPLVLLSARAGEEARVEGLQAGADDYLSKPFSGRELVARIESLLLRQRIRRIENLAARRLQSIFSQAPVAIAITQGPVHVFEQANALYQELVGQRELIGLPIRSALPEIEGQQIFELLDRVYATGQPYVGRSVPVQIMRGNPVRLTECYFDFVYQPLFAEHGAPQGLAVVVFEVTELVNAKRAAEAGSRAKDEFLAMLGHELRNPLAPIVTALQLMQLRGVTEAEKERAVIERQARHLIALVDDLLDVARVAQGKVQLRKQPIEIAEVVSRAIETASPIIEQKRHRLTIDVAAAGLCVVADTARLAQVIANLVSNAAKYTEPGGHLRVAAWRELEQVVLSVQDDGIGIAQQMLPMIFDMFVQERQALSRSQGGLGLGLAIVKSMMALHDGSVTASSDGIGQGSTFTIRLPAAADVVGQPAPPVSLGTATLEALPPALSILIVDDNEDAARMLGELLSARGHRVELALDGPAALRLTETFMPDIALLDIGLPGMDGYELASLLRQRAGPRELRLLAVTGYGQQSDRKRIIEHGFDQHLVKPVDLERLDEILNSVGR